ncbi:hypothetical protein AKJ16_DCAP04832 [Drosera capensis]
MSRSFVLGGLATWIMDSNPDSPLQEDNDSKGVFGKPSIDVAKKNYRRRLPTSSSSSDGSPRGEPSEDPISLRKDAKGLSYQTRMDDKLDPRSSRSQQDHGNDFFRRPSRSSHASTRHDDCLREDEEDKYSRLSSRSRRDHKDSYRSDYRGQDADYKRSRDLYKNGDKYTRDKSDTLAPAEDHRKDMYKDSSSDRRHGKLSREEDNYDDRDRSARSRDYVDEKRGYRNSRDYGSDRTASFGESRGRRIDAMTKRDNDVYHSNEACKDESKRSREDRKKDVEEDINRMKKHAGESGERILKGSGFIKEGEESLAKKSRFFSSGKDNSQGKEDSKQGEEPVGKVAVGQAPINSSSIAADVDAARVAAMKAAELVNKNLIGTGIMTAEQKKKLLWGNKKANTPEESSRRWDTALFSDRERQEKFNKLMGVKGEVKVENRVEGQDTEKQRELQLDLERQYTAGLRRRDGRTVGLGL